MRKHRKPLRWPGDCCRDFSYRGFWVRHHRIHVVRQRAKTRPIFVSGACNIDSNFTADTAWVGSQYDDPIGQKNGLLNVVRDQQNALGWERSLLPQVTDFAAK